MNQDSKPLTGTFVWYTGSHRAKNLWSFDPVTNTPVRKQATVILMYDKCWAAVIPGQEVFYFNDYDTTTTAERLAKLHVESYFGLKEEE